MAPHNSLHTKTSITLLILFFLSIPTHSHNTSSAAVTDFCKSTPHPQTCLRSLKLSISIGITPEILTRLMKTIQTSISEATKLSNILSTPNPKITETLKGTLQDCIELHQITLSSLQTSADKIKDKKLKDAQVYLSAALTNKDTCLEGIATASGPAKPSLIASITNAYEYVSNTLSILSQQAAADGRTDTVRREMDGSGDMIVVSKDGTGKFSTVMDAINFAPNNSYDERIFIYVKSGVYVENVEIPSQKPNIMLLGEGRDVTVITGNRSAVEGWTTFRSATVAVSGEGFVARDITFQNTAGPEKHQAVALRVNADLSAIYQCTIDGYQDTLYAHSFRQFYRECNIFGTVDFIFGNAAAVFQACNIVVKQPLPNQYTVMTAQSRGSKDETTGFSLQNCSILATEGFGGVKSYLGRPWKEYSTTVLIQTYIDGYVNPEGWVEWSDSNRNELETLYYGEFDNSGPGSDTDRRVNWAGFHVMEYDEATGFTVSEFIDGDEWLYDTSIPYDQGI